MLQVSQILMITAKYVLIVGSFPQDMIHVYFEIDEIVLVIDIYI